MSRSKDSLVPLLYERLLVQLRRAQVQIQQNDFEGKTASLQKASAIVIELIGSLDGEKSGELAARMAALYAHFGAEIGAVGRTLDTGRLTKVMEMVSNLHESWVIAARTKWPAGSTATVK